MNVGCGVVNCDCVCVCCGVGCCCVVWWYCGVLLLCVGGVGVVMVWCLVLCIMVGV